MQTPKQPDLKATNRIIGSNVHLGTEMPMDIFADGVEGHATGQRKPRLDWYV